MPDDADVVYVVPAQPPAQVERIALVAGMIAAWRWHALVGWLGFRTYEAEHAGGPAQPFRADGARRRGQPQHGGLPTRRRGRTTNPGSAIGGFADSFAHHKQAYIDDASRRDPDCWAR